MTTRIEALSGQIKQAQIRVNKSDDRVRAAHLDLEEAEANRAQARVKLARLWEEYNKAKGYKP